MQNDASGRKIADQISERLTIWSDLPGQPQQIGTLNKDFYAADAIGPSKARLEANVWLRQIAAQISGDVLSIGSRDDCDGEGLTYRSYFSQSKSYTTSDIEGNVELLLDIRSKTPLPDNKYGCILCSGVLEHVDNFKAGLDEITRILAPLGILLLGLPFRQAIHDAPQDFWRFTRHAIEYLLRDNYNIKEIKELDTSVKNFPAAYWVFAQKY